MKNQIEKFNVTNDSPLLAFLYSTIKGKSKNNIKSLLTHGNILVDNVVITKYDYQLKIGQVVSIKNKIVNSGLNVDLDIIYEDDNIIVINKPAGLLSIATNKEKEITAYHIVMEYLKQRNHKNNIFVVHRLDRDTSGILLFAKNEQMKFALQNNWNDIVTIRGYIAIVEGQLEKNSDTIISWLKETSTLLVYSSRRAGDGEKAITHYQKIKSNGKYTMLDIRIDTGRKNQIRVHMKDIGHSIIGDKKYGSKVDPLNRLGLHANILEFIHPYTKKIMHFEAEIPKEFKHLFF